MGNELKPCPFCSGVAELVDQSVEYPDLGFTKKYVTCSQGCDASTGLHTSFGAAFDAWNTRPEPTDPVAVAEAAEKVMRWKNGDYNEWNELANALAERGNDAT